MSGGRASRQPRLGSNRNVEESLLECKETLEKVMNCYKEVAVDLLSQQLQWETDEFSDELQKLQRFVHETARHDRRREWMSQIVRAMKDHVEDIAPDAPQTMADVFLQKLNDLEQRNDEDVSNHKKVTEFEDALKAVRQEQEEERQADMEVGQQDLEGDEELAMGQVQRSLTCPLTRKYFEHPVKNSRCGHTYSRQAILDHIGHSRRRVGAPCPVGGCPEVVTEADLREDKEAEKLVNRAMRKRHRRQ